LTHRHTFKRTISSPTGNQVLYYVNGSKCGPGNAAHYGVIVILPDNATGVTQNEDSPMSFKLLQNHPNPFNPSTVISFQLPVASEVSIAIYSMHGRLVRQVAKRRFASGEHQVAWDGNDDSGRRVANGNYFYQLIAGEFQSTRRMLLLK
jgi:hypothetical protein